MVLSTRVIRQDEQMLDIEFSVADTGIGLSSDQLKHIFFKFKQAESSTSRRFGGSGLGLAICKDLVELMGSTLELESQLGKGSRFFFTLHMQCAPTTKRMTPLPPMRVLVVDDSDVARETLQKMVRSFGLECDCASSGKQALQMLQQADSTAYQLILIDDAMPGLDGLETTRRLRPLFGTQQDAPAVIMVTTQQELGINPIIASVTFGETRPFQLKHISNKELKKVDIPLSNGSLLTMAGETQHYWKHQIPKTTKTLESRINLTFRQIL